MSGASNLTLLVPGTGLALLFILLLAGSRRFSTAADSFVVPGIVTAFVIVILPLTHATRDSLYVGLATPFDSLKNLVALSMFHHVLDRRISVFLPQPDVWHALFGYVLVPGVLLGAGVACVVILCRWVRRRDPALFDGPSRFLLLGGGSLVLSVGMLAGLHAAYKVLYPYGRTGLYLIPLFTLTALALPASISRRRAAFRLLGRPLWVVGVVSVGVYLLQLPTRVYGEWTYDSSTSRIVNLIRDRHQQRPLAKVRVGISWMLEPGMDFYRRVYNLTWMTPLDRKGPDGDFEYYVLLDGEAPLIKKLGLRVLYSDRTAGVYLAEPGGFRQSYK